MVGVVVEVGVVNVVGVVGLQVGREVVSEGGVVVDGYVSEVEQVAHAFVLLRWCTR